MLKIGITGGIGSGKSTVCKIFEVLDVPVFYADTEAKKLLETDEVKSFYFNHFGNLVFSGPNLDHLKIANIIFSDRELLDKVNRFIHPLVKKQFELWCGQHSHMPYIIKEAALLFESGLFKDLDYNVIIIAPFELRIDRIIKRDVTTRKKILERIKNQWLDEKKIPLANKIIYNDDTQALLPQVLEIDQFFKTIK
jgi:dephospho-CoA kinase